MTQRIIASAQSYLQKSLDALHDLKLGDTAPDSGPVQAITASLAEVDPDGAMVIARTLAYQSVFDTVVAEQISSMRVADRFNQITANFDSIRADASRLARQADAGAPSFKDRFDNIVMKLVRGDIADRFDKIKSTYQSVIGDIGDQLDREQKIMEAYLDFRYAIKQAEIEAHEILEAATARVDASRKALQAAQEEVARLTSANGADSATSLSRLSELELKRDEAQRALNEEDKRFQLAKDIAENLTTGYSVTEATMLRLGQTHDMKRRIHQRAVTFFATNTSVLSALKATYTGMVGLNEGAQTIEAMNQGLSRSLEDIAVTGARIEKSALKAGYGSGIDAGAVKKLVDSLVELQLTRDQDVAELRAEATANAESIRRTVEDGKSRLAAAVLKGKE